MATHELPLAEFAAIEPGLYFKAFLQRGQRPDGTSLQAFRPTRITPGSVFHAYPPCRLSLYWPRKLIVRGWPGGITTADASVTVDIGETRVLCGIKAEITVPSDAAPDEGLMGTFCNTPGTVH